MTEPAPPEVSYPPRLLAEPMPAWISACEALTWIAWGKPVAFAFVYEDAEALDKWGTSDRDEVLALLEQRVGTEPTHGVEMDLNRSFAAIRACLSNHITRTQTGRLRQMRARGLSRHGRQVAYKELRDELRQSIARDRQRQLLLDQATADLIEALRAEKLAARGERHLPNGDRNPAALPEPIPINVLLHQKIAITLHNCATVDIGDYAVWMAQRGNMFSNVILPSEDILRLWPPSDTSSTLPPQHAGTPLRLSEALLNYEYRARIARFTSGGKGLRPPTEADDMEWANRRFGSVPRKLLREVRDAVAPAECKKPGKRSGMIWQD